MNSHHQRSQEPSKVARATVSKPSSYVDKYQNALPLCMFPEITNPIELDEVTDLLNVIKYDNSIAQSGKPMSLVSQLVLQLVSFPTSSQNWPGTRPESLWLVPLECSDVEWEETLKKLDGSSCTMYSIEKQPSLWQRIRFLRITCSYPTISESVLI